MKKLIIFIVVSFLTGMVAGYYYDYGGREIIKGCLCLYPYKTQDSEREIQAKIDFLKNPEDSANFNQLVYCSHGSDYRWEYGLYIIMRNDTDSSYHKILDQTIGFESPYFSPGKKIQNIISHLK